MGGWVATSLPEFGSVWVGAPTQTQLIWPPRDSVWGLLCSPLASAWHWGSLVSLWWGPSQCTVMPLPSHGVRPAQHSSSQHPPPPPPPRWAPALGLKVRVEICCVHLVGLVFCPEWEVEVECKCRYFDSGFNTRHTRKL